jgi:membrane-associated phospholipid phosphatase
MEFVMDAAPWPTRRPPTPTVIAVAAAFAVVTLLGIALVDAPIARAIASYQPSKLWDGTITVLEYGLLLPVHKLALPILLVVGMLVFVVVRPLRAYAPAWMLIAGVHLVSRLTTNWIKDATGRFRPTEWIKNGGGDTFGWETGVAFPSGHVVLFASLLIPIVVITPKRWQRHALAFAIVIVGFVAAARMAVGAHFLADTAGAITYAALWTYLIGLAVRPLPSAD